MRDAELTSTPPQRTLLVALVVLTCGGRDGTADEVLRIPRHRVRISAPAEPAPGLRRLVEWCADNVNGLLRTQETPAQTITVSFDAQQKPAADPFRVALRSDTSLPEMTHALAHALLLRHARRFRDNCEPPPEALAWLAASVSYNALYCGRTASGTPAPDYEPARVISRDGKFPAVADLIELPVAPHSRPAYRLYALHCHLLTAMIGAPKAGKSRLLRILELVAHGRDPVAAVAFVMRPSFEAGEGLQRWYEREAVSMSRRGRRHSSLGEVIRRLRDLETIAVVVPGKRQFGSKRIPIDQVPDLLESYHLDSTAAVNVQRDLYELLKDAPGLLHDPLLGYINAFQALAEGKARSFKRKLKRARKTFAEATGQQRALEAFLDRVERRSTSIESQFDLYLHVVRNHARRRRSADPALHAYLDSLQR